MFRHIQEDNGLCVSNGVYKPVEIYEYGGGLYAKVGGGYVRLNANGSTSNKNVQMHTLMRDGELFRDPFGRLCVEDGKGRKPVAISAQDMDKPLQIQDMKNGS